MRKVYIVLPAYNEEESIGSLLGKIQFSMEETNIENYQVIIVNDGSTDNTKNIIEEYKKNIPVLLINHEVNQGLGKTIKDGLIKAAEISSEEDIIITMDADDTHTPGLILRMAGMIREGHDVVIASRYQHNSRVIGLAWYRKWLSYFASLYFRIFFPIKGVRDFTCGYRAYRAGVLKMAIFSYGDSFFDQEGFQAMVDILLKLRKFNLIIGEVPFILRYDLKKGQSKMNVKKTIINTLKMTVKRKFIS
jgi:dolichol-phosphate mannosyltransferase